MAKIMLVEDDNNLREIYEARLVAEGYDIVSAKDGEEALALAVKEKPELIISDVMMPKISGFDMLDILRSTPETKDTKVIMMTALSQAEDKGRADKLGADRYLVKSQVTLEDVARVARDVLSGEDVPGTAPGTAPEPTADAAPMTDRTPAVADPTVVPQPVVTPDPLQQTTPNPTPEPDAATITPAAQPATDQNASVEPPQEETGQPEDDATSTPVVADTNSQPEPTTTGEPTTPAEPPAESREAEAPTPEPPTETTPESAAVAPAGPTEAAAPEVSPQEVTTPPASPTLSDDLTQTTEQETAEAESQINEILADSYDPNTENATVAAEPTLVTPETPVTDMIAPAEPVSINVTTPDTPSAPEPAVIAPDAQKVPISEPPAETAPEQSVDTSRLSDNTDSAVTGAKKVIQPINDISKPNIDDLLKKEEATEPAPAAAAEEVVVPAQESPTPSVTSQNTTAPTSNGPSPNDISL